MKSFPTSFSRAALETHFSSEDVNMLKWLDAVQTFVSFKLLRSIFANCGRFSKTKNVSLLHYVDAWAFLSIKLPVSVTTIQKEKEKDTEKEKEEEKEEEKEKEMEKETEKERERDGEGKREGDREGGGETSEVPAKILWGAVINTKYDV